jgi:uncharacterized protein
MNIAAKKSHIINNLDFANKLGLSSERLGVDVLPRIRDLVTDVAGADSYVSYEIKGLSGMYQLPAIRLAIHIHIKMLCQRCLEPVDVVQQLSFDYVISVDEPASIHDADDVDWLEVDGEMDVRALVEDELLTSLPIAPTHQTPCKVLKMESGEKVNAFSVLKNKFK